MRNQTIIYSLNDRNAYDASGNVLSGLAIPYIYSREKIQLELKIQLDGQAYAISGVNIWSAAVDNDFKHFSDGSLLSPLSGVVTGFAIEGLTETDNDSSPATGYCQLTNSAGENESITYLSKSCVNNIVSLTTNSSLSNNYSIGDSARIVENLLIKSDNSMIDSTSAETSGIIYITLDANTLPYINEIEGSSSIDSTKFELQGKDAQSNIIFVASFDFVCLGTLDDSGAVPPGPTSDYYNKNEITALNNLKFDKNLSTYTTKTAVIDADLLPLSDSADTFAAKKLSMSNLWSYVSSKISPVYAPQGVATSNGITVSTNDKILGRATAGAGAIEEIACTSVGRALLDDTTVADQRTTLGVGTADTPTFAGVNVGGATDSSVIRATGSLRPTTGEGVEMSYFNGVGYVQGYDRGTGLYRPLCVDGSIVTLVPFSNGSVIIGTDPGGSELLRVGGDIAVAAANGVKTNHITEVTSAHGVDVDGVLCKDGKIKLTSISGLYDTVSPTVIKRIYKQHKSLTTANKNRLTVDTSVDNVMTPTGTYPGSGAFIGGVLLPDGRVFCVPYLSTTARIYDPATDTLSTPTGSYPGSYAFAGGVLLPDGRVFCVPFSSTTARIVYGAYSHASLNFPIPLLLGGTLNKF